MIAALLLLALGQVAAAAGPQGPGGGAAPAQAQASPALPSVVAILRRAKDPKSPERSTLVPELAATGQRAIPVLVDALVGGSLPVPEGSKPERLNVHQEEVLLGGLRAIGARAALRELEGRLAQSNEEPVRLAALKGYGALGGRDDLARVFQIGMQTPLEEIGEAQGGVRTAVAGLLARDPLAEPRLEALWRDCPEPLVSQVLFALGDARDGRALELASRALAQRPDLLPLVAAQIPRIGRSPRADVNAAMASALRRELDGKPGQLLAVLLRALAALEDPQAYPSLVEGLRSSDAGVRSAAAWSLQQVTGLALGSSVEPWERWLQSETEWYERAYPKLLAELRAYDPSRTAVAIRELVPHRSRRHEIAAEIAPVLDHGKPSLRALACRALGELGSVDVLVKLVAMLRDEDPEVVAAARGALRAITRRDDLAELSQWEALVATRAL